MFDIHDFKDLIYLWSVFTAEAKDCYDVEDYDNKRMLINLNPKRTAQCHQRSIAVETAIKCIIAKHPAPIFYAFISPIRSCYHVQLLAEDTKDEVLDPVKATSFKSKEELVLREAANLVRTYRDSTLSSLLPAQRNSFCRKIYPTLELLAMVEDFYAGSHGKA